MRQQLLRTHMLMAEGPDALPGALAMCPCGTRTLPPYPLLSASAVLSMSQETRWRPLSWELRPQTPLSPILLQQMFPPAALAACTLHTLISSTVPGLALSPHPGIRASGCSAVHSPAGTWHILPLIALAQTQHPC